MRCPKCDSTTRQDKIGKTEAGSQRYKCFVCGCRYTPVKKPRGYDPEMRRQAVDLYINGMNLREIGRHLGIHHTTVSSWIKVYLSKISDVTLPEQVHTAEMDASFNIIGKEKERAS
jgi:transposase